jgi:hypothetical protein
VGQTPRRINEILPGAYNLRVEKEGFIPFEKIVQVEPDLACEENTVELFLDQKTEEEIAKNVAYFEILKNKKEVFLASTNKIRKISFENNKTEDLFSLPKIYNKIFKFFKNKDENKLILKVNNREKKIKFLYLFGEKFAKIKNISNIFGIDFEKVDFVNGSSYLLGKKNNILYLLDVGKKNNILYLLDVNKDIKYPLSQNLGNYSSLNYNVYYTSNKSNTLFKYDIKKKTKEVVFQGKTDYKDLRSEEETEGSFEVKSGTLIRDEEKKNIYFLSNDHKLITIEKNPCLLASDFGEGILDNLNRLLFKLNGEIRLFERGEKETFVLARFAENIEKIAWHDHHYYVFFQIKDEIRSIATDGTNDLRLYTGSGQKLNFNVYNKSDEVYLIINDSENLKKVRVQ